LNLVLKFFSIFLLVLLILAAFVLYPSAKAFGSTGPTVSASPPGGTYNSTQSVTLASSTPSTIFYTTDGTTPTTSSTNGTSPVTIPVSANSTLQFFARDNLGNVGPVGSSKYTIILPVIIQMSTPVSTTGFGVYKDKQIRSEFVSSTSQLVGKSIDTIVVDLEKTGLPSGPVQIGVFNSDLSVKQLFGTINSTTLKTRFMTYSFSLTPAQSYMIQAGDRIGIKFTGGNSSNYATIMTDLTNTFDGTNSYLYYYDTAWHPFKNYDLYMILSLHQYGTGPTVSASPPGGTFFFLMLVRLA
jgi:hypothetical protein